MAGRLPPWPKPPEWNHQYVVGAELWTVWAPESRGDWAWVIWKWQDFPQPNVAISQASHGVRMVLLAQPLAGISQMVESLYFKASAWHAAWRIIFCRWDLFFEWIRRYLGRPAIWNWRRCVIWSTLQVASSRGHQHELDQLCASCSWAASLPGFVRWNFKGTNSAGRITGTKTEPPKLRELWKHQTYSRHFGTRSHAEGPSRPCLEGSFCSLNLIWLIVSSCFPMDFLLDFTIGSTFFSIDEGWGVVFTKYRSMNSFTALLTEIGLKLLGLFFQARMKAIYDKVRHKVAEVEDRKIGELRWQSVPLKPQMCVLRGSVIGWDDDWMSLGVLLFIFLLVHCSNLLSLLSICVSIYWSIYILTLFWLYFDYLSIYL